MEYAELRPDTPLEKRRRVHQLEREHEVLTYKRNKWDSVIPFDLLWKQYSRIIKDTGAIVLFANGMFTADLMQSNRKMWRYNLVWEKA